MQKRGITLLLVTLLLLLSACSFNQAAYNEAIETGLVKLEQRDYTQAEQAFRSALNEKPNDDQASHLLDQTLLIKRAEDKVSNGHFTEATKLLSRLQERQDLSEHIAGHLDELRTQMKAHETAYADYTALYDEAGIYFSEEQFDEALHALASIPLQELTHPYYTDLKHNAEKRQAEIMDAQEAARANSIGFLDGYWYNEDMNEACHFTNAFIHCAVPKSDVITEADVTEINWLSETELDVSYVGEEFMHETEEYVTMRFTVNYEHIEPDLIYINEDSTIQYKRVSKNEANAIFFGEYELN